ncbi:hypothetical protein T492DRAFT_1112888 [Pavlovales sp. CCMP2436]|nr:hypothetical protein T492DRAFT_1112888 [Pavlovales sp. CCMP2436]
MVTTFFCYFPMLLARTRPLLGDLLHHRAERLLFNSSGYDTFPCPFHFHFHFHATPLSNIIRRWTWPLAPIRTRFHGHEIPPLFLFFFFERFPPQSLIFYS